VCCFSLMSVTCLSKKHSGHCYEIHPQPELPSVNMHYHMCQWLLFLQNGVYGWELCSNDYIFPSISGNRSAHPEVPISHDTIQKWLDEFVREAGI
ncbi:hypothetical protein JB92DRAFT_2585955, partial [Gautieria morchelliformis]